eukprot:jgi/Bigna1/65656/fgenesh1_kg.121_\
MAPQSTVALLLKDFQLGNVVSVLLISRGVLQSARLVVSKHHRICKRGRAQYL